MKFIIIITIASLIQVSAATYAQKVTLSKESITLKALFKEITRQTGYEVIYADKTLNDQQKVNVEFNNTPLKQVLEVALNGLAVTYVMDDKGIIIKEKDKSILDRVKDLFVNKDIDGRVVDENGFPLPGASVKVKNTNQSAVTNQYGWFTLKGVAEDAVIIVSYIGYKPFEVQSNFAPPLLIKLERSESKLDEVQVIAYGLTTRRLSTGDVSTVKAADIEKQDVNNPLLALQGRVPGLTITPSSGLPGSPMNVQIRGVNTLGSVSGVFGSLKTAQPLFIIDGIPYANNIETGGGTGNLNGQMSAFSFVNPSDIESIDVLKDADATAIYGSRGANGVILITTKKGKMGANTINANVSNSYGEVPKMLNLLNTQQYLEVRKEAYKNDGLPLPVTPSSRNYDLTVYDQNRYTDWQKELIGGTARYTNAQVSISGGSPTVQYLVSGNYSKQGYVFPGDASNTSGFGHFSITGNSLNSKFKATLTGTYTANSRTTARDFTSLAEQTTPNAPAVYNTDGSLNWEPDPNTGFATWANPFASLLNTTTQKTNVLNSSASLSYQVLRSLTLKSDIGFSDVKGNVFSETMSTSVDPKYIELGIVSPTSAFFTFSSRSWSIEPQILYHVNTGPGRLDAVVGASLQAQTQEFQQISASGFTSDALLKNLASAGSYLLSNTSSEYRSEAVFGRLTYNWADKYIVDVSARRDGSSRFGPRDQFGNFGSAGAAWIFTNEDFLKKVLPFMSFGKLRFSYGTSGNDGIGDYQYLELYQNIDENPTYQGVKGIVSQGVTNPYYHWEQTRKAEVGMETGFFQDRILLSASYYRNRSSDQLGTYSLPATAGNSSNFVVNQPAMIQNSGWEFTLNSRDVNGEHFKWSTSASLSFQRNKLLALPTEGVQAYGLDPRTKVGDPFSGVAYVHVYRGVDPVTGLYQFSGTNGGLTSSGSTAITTISTTPQFYGGFSNALSYKGFSLDIFLQFTKQMGVNYLYARNPGTFLSGNGNLPAVILTRWQNPGDLSNIQRFTTKNSGDVYNSWNLAAASTAAYVDASFVKVKNVSLSYTIPQIWKEKSGIKNLRVYLQGQNLWTITGYKGLDPETQSIARLPQLRILTAGIQAGF